MKGCEIYLDCAATTPVDPDVVDAMVSCMGPDGVFGNPSSTHDQGKRAKALVEEARASVAARVNVPPESIVFTSGATEANNLALRGVLEGGSGGLITARTEHKSVLDTAKALAAEGIEVTYLECDRHGVITADQVAEAIGERTRLVSIMHVNNETGVMQDIESIARVCRARGVLMHVDAAQSVGKVDVDVRRWDADLVSLNAHKSHGPKGVGALYLRPGLRIVPLLLGGEQERGLRAGTLATHQIVGMGRAFELADPKREGPRLARLSGMLREGLAAIEGVRFNGDPGRCAPHIVNATFPGVEGESLRFALADIAVSAGSACNSDSPDASHVLTSMGLDDALATGSLRFSVGRFTTMEEVERAVQRVQEEVGRLRDLAADAPSWCSGRSVLG